MPAYLLLLVALLSRLLPHSDWYGFTAVGGSLLYFGARRANRHLWEMILPVALLAGTDYYLTTRVYGYSFVPQDYAITWGWYVAAIVLGRILLGKRTSFPRAATAAVLGPTSFFLVSNYAAWLSLHIAPHAMYAPNFGGIMASYAAGLPFYGRDLVSTALVLGIALGLPILLRRMQHDRAVATH